MILIAEFQTKNRFDLKRQPERKVEWCQTRPSQAKCGKAKANQSVLTSIKPLSILIYRKYV